MSGFDFRAGIVALKARRVSHEKAMAIIEAYGRAKTVDGWADFSDGVDDLARRALA